MVYFLYIIIGTAFAALITNVYDVCSFIRFVDNGEDCQDCNRKKDGTCVVGKNTIFQSDFVSSWLIVSYYLCSRLCINNKFFVSSHGLKNKVIVSGVSFMIYLLPCWSLGCDIISMLYGITAIMLLYISIIDWNTQYIPFECSIIILLCGLIRIFADNSNWWEYVIGLFAVSGFLYIVDSVFTPVLRRKYDDESIDCVIGDGDIKLMAATGLLIGWKLNFLALGIGCIIGSIIHLSLIKIKESKHNHDIDVIDNEDIRFAFGPYLSLGVYITMICGEQLVSWYLNVIGFYSY